MELERWSFRIAKALEVGTIDKGSIAFIDVRHEKSCSRLLSALAPCNCDPDVVITTADGLFVINDEGLFSPYEERE